jgi:DNA-binding SARP family transcriptional activator
MSSRKPALNSLYYALHIVRGVLDRGTPSAPACLSALQLAGGVLTLAPTGLIAVDVEAFEAAAAAALQSRSPRAHHIALDLYAGELLPGDRYEDWAARPRERLHDVHLRLLWELADVHRERGQFREAIGTFSRLVAAEPTHEEARAGLMRLYAVAGQRWNALREYERLRTALREELNLEPDTATQQLYADILASRAAAETTVARVASNPPATLTSFTGRERELGRA